MDINLTLLGEVISFIIFIWFCFKYVWPPLMKIMEDRRKLIADGIAAGEQGKKDLELAEHKSKDMLADAKAQASTIIEQAHQRANHIVEEAKQNARIEGERLLCIARSEIDLQANTARDQLMAQVASIAVAGAEKILKREVNSSGSDQLVKEVLSEIADGG
jgi:F-type H+-transporting ATPase subunit b